MTDTEAEIIRALNRLAAAIEQLAQAQVAIAKNTPTLPPQATGAFKP